MFQAQYFQTFLRKFGYLRHGENDEEKFQEGLR